MLKRGFTLFSVLALCSATAWASSGDDYDYNAYYTDGTYSAGNWNGFYLGAGAGYVAGTTNTTFAFRNVSPTQNLSSDLSAANLIGVIGYSHTFNRFYLGGEVDAGGFLGNASQTHINPRGTTTTNEQPTWSVTPALLLGGLITPKWLVYGRLGMPMMGMDNSATFTDTFFNTSYPLQQNNQFNIGVLGGLGFGYSLTPHWQLRVEDDVSHLWGSSDNGRFGGSTSSQSTFNNVLGTLTYQFGPSISSSYEVPRSFLMNSDTDYSGN